MSTRTSTPPAAAGYVGPHTDPAPLEITVVLRRRAGAVLPASGWPRGAAAARADFAQRCGADPGDLEAVRRFARSHALTESGADVGRRVIHLRASPAALEAAFGVRLGRYRVPGLAADYLSCDHPPALPPGALAVLGLDRRPVAHPHMRRPHSTPAQTYTPLEVGALYGYPAGTDGSGQSVAIIELGGGFSSADLATYFAGLKIAHPPAVTAVGVAGGSNTPGGDADGEVMLDIEVIGALAPGAAIAVYFAPNTDQGFFEAVSQAAHDSARHNTVMSISWGGPESSGTANARTALASALEDAAALGVTVTVASGDSGSSDGLTGTTPHVDFPASSPYVLACGGTKLVASGARIASEVVWNETATGEGASGGGVSVEFAQPAWQARAGVPKAPGGKSGRGVPDVAGNADPQTGYRVLVDGQSQVIGGTSAVAPLWAALIARLNEKLGTPLGDLHEALYQLPAGTLRDIVSGNNGAYAAGPGWDACTGLGSPDGTALLSALAAQKR
ncbi:MAG: S8 family serine peptidase [Proteobacteria bacterium]|nr:S8 family serine peptidase [Pseudomonadota bacterium]